MKIALIGGHGFIGQNIIKNKPASWRIDVFDLCDGFDITQLNNDRDFMRGIKDQDVIINLACRQLAISDQYPVFDAETNIIGPLRLLHFLERLGKDRPKLVHFSTGSIYQMWRKVNHYSFSKAAGDNYVQLYVKKYGLDATIIRPYQVFGWRGHGITNKFLQQVKTGQPYNIHGTGEQVVTPTHIDDMVEIADRIIAGGHWREVFTVAGNETVSVNMLADLIDEVSGYTNGRSYNMQPDHYKGLQFTVSKDLLLHNNTILGWKQPYTLKERLEQEWMRLNEQIKK